jgi:hypothetical protein
MIGEEEAIRRAKAFLAQGPGVFEFEKVFYGKAYAREGRMEWRVVFRNADERFKHFDPNEVWVLVDTEDGSVRLFPMI